MGCLMPDTVVHWFVTKNMIKYVHNNVYYTKTNLSR